MSNKLFSCLKQASILTFIMVAIIGVLFGSFFATVALFEFFVPVMTVAWKMAVVLVWIFEMVFFGVLLAELDI